MIGYMYSLDRFSDDSSAAAKSIPFRKASWSTGTIYIQLVLSLLKMNLPLPTQDEYSMHLSSNGKSRANVYTRSHIPLMNHLCNRRRHRNSVLQPALNPRPHSGTICPGFGWHATRWGNLTGGITSERLSKKWIYWFDDQLMISFVTVHHMISGRSKDTRDVVVLTCAKYEEYVPKPDCSRWSWVLFSTENLQNLQFPAWTRGRRGTEFKNASAIHELQALHGPRAHRGVLHGALDPQRQKRPEVVDRMTATFSNISLITAFTLTLTITRTDGDHQNPVTGARLRRD